MPSKIKAIIMAEFEKVLVEMENHHGLLVLIPNRCTIWISVFGAVFSCIPAIIFINLSFAGLEYHEFGFVRQRSTGIVDTSKVYESGRHVIGGPDFEFKKFRRDAHFLDLNSISVFTSDKLEVSIAVNIQYFLRKDELHFLHERYDVDYEKPIRSTAIAAIKNSIPIFSLREFLGNRTDVERRIHKAVHEKLGGECCLPGCSYPLACYDGCIPQESCEKKELRGMNVNALYLQLGKVEVPQSVSEDFLKAITLQEDAVRETFRQDAALVRKLTSSQVQQIKNEANEIHENALTQAALIERMAKANYTLATEVARTQGLMAMFSHLNISRQDIKQSMEYLRTLKGTDNIRLTVNFDQRIAELCSA